MGFRKISNKPSNYLNFDMIKRFCFSSNGDIVYIYTENSMDMFWATDERNDDYTEFRMLDRKDFEEFKIILMSVVDK